MIASNDLIFKLLNELGTTVEKGDVVSKVDHMSKKLMESKSLYEKSLKNKMIENSKLLSETQDIEKNIDFILDQAENIKNELAKEITHLNELPTGNQESAVDKLNKTINTQKLLCFLKKLYSNVEETKTKIDENKYVEAAMLIQNFQELNDNGIPECNANFLKRSKIISHLYSSSNKLKINLNNKFDNILSDTIKWSSYEDGNCFYEKLAFEDIDEGTWFSLLTAMIYMKTLDQFLSRFSKNLLTRIFEPLVKHDSTINSVNENSISFATKIIHTKLKHEQHLDFTKSETVLKSVNQVLDFIGKKLLFHKKKQENEKRILSEEIRSKLSLDLFKMIAREVIDKSAPASNEKIENFNKLVFLAKNCQKTAEKYFLIDVNDNEVNFLLGDAETAYITHKCSNVLSKSRSLLKQPLHNTVVVGNVTFKKSDPVNDFPKIEDGFPIIELQPMFDFPLCQISTNVQALWQNIEQLLEDIASTNQQSVNNCLQLYKCVCNVIELFINIIPTFHDHSLQSLPFLAALHHNNCMYMAHQLMYLQRTLRYKFIHYPNIASFVDYIDELRRLGADNFVFLLQKQNQNILQNLKSDTGFDSMSEPSNYEKMDKNCKKVFLELRHILNAWIGVLPATLLYKSIGSLYDISLEEIVNGIIKLEDISETDTTKLLEILSMIEKDGIELFCSMRESASDAHSSDPSIDLTLQKYAKRWTKLKEIKFVLNARLMEIRDRWASGKGPLAEVFTNVEMDRLIRALFQNTEMRSVVLSIINKN